MEGWEQVGAIIASIALGAYGTVKTKAVMHKHHTNGGSSNQGPPITRELDEILRVVNGLAEYSLSHDKKLARLHNDVVDINSKFVEIDERLSILERRSKPTHGTL